MALGLKFTDGSTTLFDCSSSGRYVDGQNGWQRGQPTDDENVMDTFVIMVQDDTTDIQSDASTINRILELAETYEDEGIGSRIYLEGALDGSNWRRSPVVGGRVVSYDLDSAIRSGFSQITVQVERKDFFDGAETTLALTNTNGSGVTTGLRIYNTNDGATVDTSYHRCNYVQVSGSAVAGDLPCPVKLDLGFEGAVNRLYIGCGWANTQTLDPLIEAEDTYGGTADSGCSGGYYQARASNWVPIMTSGTGQPNWYLPILRARITGAAAKLKYWVNSGKPRTIYLTQETDSATDWQLFPLSILRAPAEGPNMGITFYWEYGVSQDTDFVHLLPANFWRIAERVSDDPSANQYQENGYTERAGFISTIERPTVTYGPGIYLMPGKDQRIWALYQDVRESVTNSSDLDKHCTVTLTYRPRYRSL